MNIMGNVLQNTQTSKQTVYTFCQAPSQNPNPQGPAPTQSNPVKISSKGTGADTKILWATTHPTPLTHNF